MRPNRKNLQELYKKNALILTNEQAATTGEKIAALNYFRDAFKQSTTPPTYFSRDLLDVFIAYMQREQYDMQLPNEAAAAIVALLREETAWECAPLAHQFLGKGGLEAIEAVLRTTVNLKLREACIMMAGSIAVGCGQCSGTFCESRSIIDLLAKEMASLSLEATRVVFSCFNVGDSLPTTIFHVILTATSRFEDEKSILEHSLEIISGISDVPVNSLLDTDGFLTRTMGVLAHPTEWSKSAVCGALKLIGKIMTNGTREQQESVCMRGGFVRLISSYLDSADPKLINAAVSNLHCLAKGHPTIVDLLLTDNTPIPRLLQLLRDDEYRSIEVLCIFEHMLASLHATPRPSKMETLLGYGVVAALVRFACKFYHPESEIVIGIKETLLTVLHTYPAFWKVVEQASTGPTPLLPIPARLGRRPVDYVFEDEEGMEP